MFLTQGAAAITQVLHFKAGGVLAAWFPIRMTPSRKDQNAVLLPFPPSWQPDDQLSASQNILRIRLWLPCRDLHVECMLQDA